MRYRPGVSGNPAGRPAGIRNRNARLLDEMLPEAERKAIVRKLAELAKEGDVPAANALLDRIWPKLRTVAPCVEIPLPGDGALAAKAGAIVDAVTRGHLAPDIGSELINALGAIARLRELDELEQRLRALEAKVETKK